MFHAEMQAAIESARTLARMDELSRQLWQGHGSGILGDAEAQGLAESLQERRSAIREGIRPLASVVPGRPSLFLSSLFPPRRSPASPDRLVSRNRRRLLASSGPMPPTLAARFTEGQRAVLRIVADEVKTQDVCDLCIDAIAARAGVSRRLTQSTLRLAESDGLLTIEERRHQGRKNSPNLVRIVSREWQSWIRRGGKRKSVAGESVPPQTPLQSEVTGCKPLHPTDRGDNYGDKDAFGNGPEAAGTTKRNPPAASNGRSPEDRERSHRPGGPSRNATGESRAQNGG